MRRIHSAVLSLGIGVALAAVALAAPETVDGILKVEPIQERSCLAVRVDVPIDSAVSGMRWYNGSATTAFAQILAAAGTDILPPLYAESVPMLEAVTGVEDGWTEATFPQPVTSTTGVLYITFQYPAGYIPPGTGLPLGIGYSLQEGVGHYYASGDGDVWVKISGRCQPLLEPVFGVNKAKILVLGQPKEEEASDQKDLPRAFAAVAFPNPFNPKATIRLSLPQGADSEVKVYDIRGRVVTTLHDGYLEAGTQDLNWWGRDDRGQGMASGVYLVKSRLGEKTFINRLVLLK